MIAAISLMRRQENGDLNHFRRHWLDVHGPLVCAFPKLRRYVQCHVIDSPATNDHARSLQIDGFPILYFENDTDRLAAHHCPEMAACNIDSRLFVGAVARVIADAEGDGRDGLGRFSVIELWPVGSQAPKRPMRYHVREQGRAPNSTIPHLAIEVGHATQTWFDSLVDLEAQVAKSGEKAAARFVVEEHWLV